MKRLRQLIFLVTLGSVAVLIALSFNPVNSTGFKLLTLCCLLGGWAGVTILRWRSIHKRWLRILLVCAPLIALLPFVLPGRAIDVDRLREDYVERMVDFEGTTYSWGGESSRGIDCSGLPRRAYRDALLSYGFRRVNGRAFRQWAEQWWFDASARALGEEYRDYTEPLGLSGTIKTMEYHELEPGDLAVTKGGAHILAYLGEGKWIQADPGLGKVAILDGKLDKNNWFGIPVSTYRWQGLVD